MDSDPSQRAVTRLASERMRDQVRRRVPQRWQLQYPLSSWFFLPASRTLLEKLRLDASAGEWGIGSRRRKWIGQITSVGRKMLRRNDCTDSKDINGSGIGMGNQAPGTRQVPLKADVIGATPTSWGSLRRAAEDRVGAAL